MKIDPTEVLVSNEDAVRSPSIDQQMLRLVLQKRNREDLYAEDLSGVDQLGQIDQFHKFLPYVVEKEPVVRIESAAGTEHIYNSQIIEVFGGRVHGLEANSDGRHVYLYTCMASGQYGGFAIYNLSSRSWVASHLDDLFCVSGLLYIEEKELFIGHSYGYTKWHDVSESKLFAVSRSGEVFLDLIRSKVSNFEAEGHSIETSLRPPTGGFLRYYRDHEVVEVETEGEIQHFELRWDMVEEDMPL